MKYTKIDGVVGWSGGTTVLRKGAAAEDDHPLVKERPDLFEDEPSRAELRVQRPRVETNVQRPGAANASKPAPAKPAEDKPAPAKAAPAKAAPAKATENKGS